MSVTDEEYVDPSDLPFSQRPMKFPRMAQIMEVPKHFEVIHFRAITINGRKFVYCPVGNICSLNKSDYDNEWCHFCGKYFSELKG